MIPIATHSSYICIERLLIIVLDCYILSIEFISLNIVQWRERILEVNNTMHIISSHPQVKTKHDCVTYSPRLPSRMLNEDDDFILATRAELKHNFVGSRSIYPGGFVPQDAMHLHPDDCFDSP